MSWLLTRGQLARKVKHMQAKTKKIEEAAKHETPERLFANRVADFWHVRTMLADAHLSPEVLSGICSEFTRQENSSISSTQIGKVRDAFVEIIKDMQAKAMATLLPTAVAGSMLSMSASSAASPALPAAVPTVYLSHEHDGADLRARSKSSAQASNASITMPRHAMHMSRSRASKIQNQKLDVHVGMESLPWYSEMQAMEDKTAASIATTIISLISDALRAIVSSCIPLLSGTKVRVLHLCTGDATNSNEAALRLVRVRRFRWSSSPQKLEKGGQPCPPSSI